MSMFESLSPLPGMPKYLLVERFLADSRPDKILGATGAFKNVQGETPRLECVRLAEQRIDQRGLERDYLDPIGYRPFIKAMERLLFDDSLAASEQNRIRTVQTPGGTAALRTGADLLQKITPGRAIWISDPTWGNHLKVFRAAGLDVKTYPYSVTNGILDADRLIDSLRNIPRGDLLFLQASTHNPSCVDLAPDLWQQVAQLVSERELVPFFDAAFFGFTTGLREDLDGLNKVLATGCEALVAASLSKSFALYNRRTGSLSVIGRSAESAENAFSHIQHLIRANYSNPPLDGAAIVAEILTDPALFSTWKSELKQMRERMQSCRQQIAAGLRANGVKQDLSYMTCERGLFTRVPLTPNQSEELIAEHAIYLTPTGRFNVTAITDSQIECFCREVSRYWG